MNEKFFIFQLFFLINLAHILICKIINDSTKLNFNLIKKINSNNGSLMPKLYVENQIKINHKILTTTTKTTTTKKKKINTIDSTEMLVPLGSTTALICEPIFNENLINKLAFWYKDGKKIAAVNGHTNAVYNNRMIEFAGPIPKVGFLIITKIKQEDQGDYWCEREDNGARGERSRLRVAFFQNFNSLQQPIIHFFKNNQKERSGDFFNGKFVGRPFLGETIAIECPETKAIPKPIISWHFDGETIDFTDNRLEMQKNGTLLIRRFSSSDSGTYECVLTNFAGRTSTKIFIGLPISTTNEMNLETNLIQSKLYSKSPDLGLSITCIDYFRNEILWFLIGCLTTSCIVLIYMISGLIFFKCSKRARNHQINLLPYYQRRTNNNSFWRSLLFINPNILPGFRKVVAPASFTNRNRVSSATNQQNHLHNSNDQLLLANNAENNNNNVYKSIIT